MSTLAQKQNIERFKKVQDIAKKLKAANPKLKHVDAVKKAWATMPKIIVGVKNKMSKQQIERLNFLQTREDNDILTIAQNKEYEKLVKLYRKTKPVAKKKAASKKVGGYKVVEVGEKPSNPVSKIVQVKRTPGGTFKKFTTIGTLQKRLAGFFDTSIIKDIDQLKKEYFKLAKVYHPDKGGTTAQFQELGKEYDKLLKKLLSSSNLNQEQQNNEIVIDDAIKAAFDAIVTIPNITIELIGKWLWVTGNTYPVRNELKSAGLTFIKKDNIPYWVYKGVESTSRGTMSKNEIEAKYGKHSFTAKDSKKLSGIVKPLSGVNRTKFLKAMKRLTIALNKRPI